jgi:hypothetical protein
MKQYEEFIGLMEGTVPYTRKTLSFLSGLTEKYPYFQTAHILHTLNLLHLKDTHFLFDLRKTAVYAPDRKQLFFRIEGDFFDPELLERLEEETFSSDSTFELIDHFLSENSRDTEMKTIEPELSQVSTDYASHFLTGIPESEAAPPLQHQETIDKFLEEEAASPRKIKLDRTGEPVEELPEPLSESAGGEGFFTETLAKIYIKQKRYSKALEIIRQLNLIYPEKNRYFADQIRFLEKLVINTDKIK